VEHHPFSHPPRGADGGRRRSCHPTTGEEAHARVRPDLPPTRPVPPDDLPRRNNAAREWALALRRDGKVTAAAPLEDAGFAVTEKSVTPVSPERAVGAVLVIQAKDLDSAVALVKGHPGLAYGTEIEVRPLKVVPPPK